MSTPDQAFANLLEVGSELDTLGIRYWLDGGALLGVMRDGDFPPDDHNDIDLSTWATNKHLIPDLIDAVTARGFRLYHHWTGDPDAPGMAPEVAFARDGLKIDVFFFETAREDTWHLIYRQVGRGVYRGTPVVAPFRLLEEFTTVTWRGATFTVPADYDGYLTHRYGDWRTPVHRSQFTGLQNLDPGYPFHG